MTKAQFEELLRLSHEVSRTSTRRQELDEAGAGAVGYQAIESARISESDAAVAFKQAYVRALPDLLLIVDLSFKYWNCDPGDDVQDVYALALYHAVCK